MAYDKLIAQIANRPIVIDESVNFFGLRPALDRAGVVWREFPRRTKDETIAEGMLPEEILLQANGTIDFRIMRGMRLLFTRKVKDWRGYTVLEPI